MRFSPTLVLLFLNLYSLAGAMKAQTVVSETRWPGYLGYGLLVGEKDMTPAKLTPYFRNLMRREQAALLNVRVYTNDARMEAFWTVKFKYPAYQHWRMEVERLNRTPIPMAEFLAIRGAGVLRIRSADGSLKTVFLGKPDSTGLLGDHDAARVLSVSLGEWLYEPPRKERHVTLFIQTADPLNEETCRRLLAQVGDLGFYHTELTLRNDSWFIDEAAFPAFYAFQPRIQPPSHHEYWNSQTMFCSQYSGKPARFGVNKHSGNPPPGEPEAPQ
jgi:hypothetical protein